MPQALVETGLPGFMLPRFSLKEHVRVEIVAPGEEAEAALGREGQAVFTGPGGEWRLRILAPDHPGTQRFGAWITTGPGQRAITGFLRDGVQVFSLPTPETDVLVDRAFYGDAGKGLQSSRRMCARCHVVEDGNRMNAIGSTPSFFVLRSLRDWEARLGSFFTLNPHPAFTQVTGVTEPFPASRPSPIFPLELSVDDIDDILAYVAALPPADLGPPMQHQ